MAGCLVPSGRDLRAACGTLLLLAGGAGEAAAADRDRPDPTLMSYRLPRTDAAVKVSLEVTACDATKVTLVPGLVVVAVAKPGPTFTLARSALESKRFERGMEMKLHPNGTIASLNGAVTDKRPDAIASVFKIALKVVTLGVSDAVAQGVAPKPLCKEAIVTALARKQEIEAAIARLRADAAKPATAEGAGVALGLLAQELAALKSDRLTIESTHPFRLDKTGAQAAQTVSLAGILTTDAPLTLALTASAADAKIPDGSAMAPAYSGAAECAVPRPSGKGRGKPPAAMLCAPTAVPMKIVATLTATTPVDFEGATTSTTATHAVTAPAAQWREPARIDLATGFAGKFSYGASFDSFGMLTEAKWTSEARNARALSAIADSVGAAGDIIKAATPEEDATELETMQADIALLEAKQKLRKLNACEEKLATGLSCDAAPAQKP